MIDTFAGKPLEAWYINLAERPDRREHMERELARVGVAAERFEALRPDDYTGDPARIAGMLARPQRGAIGCWLSQRAVLEKALASGKTAFVLEDDVVFCDDLGERLRYLEERLPIIDPGWDVLSLGGCFHVPSEWHRDDPLGRDVQCTSDPRIMRLYGSWFTWAWMVRASSVRKVTELLDENLPNSWGIDHNFIQLGARVRSYCFVPGCSKQMDGKSNIGLGHTIFSAFAKLGPYWFQPRAEMFDPERFDWMEAAQP